jgi:hypothetical protein
LIGLPAVTGHGGCQEPQTHIWISKVYEAIAPSSTHLAKWYVEKIDMAAKVKREHFIFDLTLFVPEGYVAQHDSRKPVPVTSVFNA